MKIYIDADACPVTRIAERVAKARGCAAKYDRL